MKSFKFNISRTYTITEGFEREFQAETLAEAQALADDCASDSNGDCPDDCNEDERGFSESGDFEAELVK